MLSRAITELVEGGAVVSRIDWYDSKCAGSIFRQHGLGHLGLSLKFPTVSALTFNLSLADQFG